MNGHKRDAEEDKLLSSVANTLAGSMVRRYGTEKAEELLLQCREKLS